MVFADGELLDTVDLPLGAAARPMPTFESLIGPAVQNAWPRLQELVKSLERQLLTRALSAYADHPNEEIARLLGTSRRILELRLQEFALKKKT